MRRQAKASSAGSTKRQATGLGRIFRGVFAPHGPSGDTKGTGAPSPAYRKRRRVRLALFAASGIAILALTAAPAALASGNVNVTVEGPGSGTVTSTAAGPFEPFIGAVVSPGQIDCDKSGGPICSANFSVSETFFGTNVTVTLTATPDAGWAFGGWSQSGASSVVSGCAPPPGAANTCVIVLSGEPGPTSTISATFEPPPPPPSVFTDGTTDGPADHLVTLKGHVNPNGTKTNQCRFVYGPTADYGQSVSCDKSAAEIGSGNDDVPVAAVTAPLEPDTVYHFRLLAGNPGGVAQGKDRTFTTGPAPADDCPNADIRAEQGIEVMLLPDCMALEQVSPSSKGNQHARAPSSLSISGDRVLFNSIATLGNCPNINVLGGDPFLASRDGDGWNVECINLPYEKNEELGATLSFIGLSGFSADFSSWFQYGTRASDELFQYFRVGVGGATSPISAPFQNLNGAAFFGPQTVGNSADLSKLYFRAEGDRNQYYVPGDPVPAGAGEDYNLYIAELDGGGNPTTTLFARDRDGKVWGANCGIRLGGMEDTSGGNLNQLNGQRNQGAISPNGARVYFSTRPDQSETGNCTATNKKRIMERLETSTGPEMKELISSECTRISPPCATHDGDDAYQGASVDQTKIYFTTNRQLTNSDLDGTGTSCAPDDPPPGSGYPSPPYGFRYFPGCDLYLYDREKPAGQRLTQVSAGEESAPTPGAGANVANGVAAISADGSHVYFAAAGVLTADPSPSGDLPIEGEPNFYVWNAETEDLSFIGGPLATGPKFSDNDGWFSGTGLWLSGGGTWSNAAYPVPIKGTDAKGNEVGGDGHILFFNSKAPLTADDNDGSMVDLFRYDAETHQLERVSGAVSGGVDNGPFTASGAFNAGTGSDYAIRGRPVSEDGDTVVFRSEEALLPGDLNGAEDVYMRRGGQLYRLPGSTLVPKTPSNTPVLSGDGSVAYHSIQQLVASDGDTALDVYVARVGGGFRTPVESTCQGEACQGPPTTPREGPGVSTSSFLGSGNVSRAGQRCQRLVRRARKFRRGAKALRRASHRGANSHRGKVLRRRANRFAKRAKRNVIAAKRCRRANRRAGR